MLNERPAADELAEVQAKILSLKAREEHLRAVLLKDPISRHGLIHEAEVKVKKERMFRKERLPGYILRDRSFWEEQVTRDVVLHGRQSRSSIGDGWQGRGIRPGDPVLSEEVPDVFRLVPNECYHVVDATCR